MKQNPKKDDWDDGRTIASMDGVSSPFSDHDKTSKLRNQVKDEVTKKERRAMIRGMFVAMLPRVSAILLGFAAAIGLMYLWLS